MGAAKVAYKNDDTDREYASITTPNAANENTQPLTKKTAPTTARLLNIRQQRLAEKKAANENTAPTAVYQKTTVSKARKRSLLNNQKGNNKKLNGHFQPGKVIRASEAAFESSIYCSIIFLLQLFGSVTYILSTYISDETWYGFFLPTEYGKYIAFAAIIVAAVAATAVILGTFGRNFINPLKGLALLVFPVCICLSLIPYTAFLPWLLIWIWAIPLSQKSHK